MNEAHLDGEKEKMKKRFLPLLLVILLMAACGKSTEQADIADYYREIYGADRVIERHGLYYELIYRYVLNREWEDRFYILPLAGEDEEPYGGNEFSLAPDRSVYGYNIWRGASARLLG